METTTNKEAPMNKENSDLRKLENEIEEIRQRCISLRQQGEELHGIISPTGVATGEDKPDVPPPRNRFVGMSMSVGESNEITNEK